MSTTTQIKQTLDQRRANHAWKAILSFSRNKPNGECEYDEAAKEYAREAHKLPTRIMAAGLGQALAFILAKAKDKKPNLRLLHDHLTDWVIRQRPISSMKPDSLLESVIEGDSDFLRRTTDEALAYLLWLNRFAEAEGLTEGAD
ncbi:MAG: type III-B CRISPR module-associated protein Cmr5 [Acidobacteria bacterium]|nr:type III-B CRISPR module-associated protein Cmr5 [Acidobacteriota bacterium]MCI0426815.1 type III-B CRISPR module-associated protein Cmr5 [Nitrospiraceae bacterium]MCI0621558.1 type III-B CRISPR module-associated protein Cmr5 [Acidobacteriota bacterium]